MAVGNAQRKPWISPQDYLAAERGAEVRHEYVDGEIFAMVGASRRHAAIVGNLFVALRQAARARGCQAYANDVRFGSRRRTPSTIPTSSRPAPAATTIPMSSRIRS
nr:Uma2 family endonuclease [Azospirillum ramasamyi]